MQTHEPGSPAAPLQQVPASGDWADRRAALDRRTSCARLSRKERNVLQEVARGNSTDEIGLLLGVSPHTVRTHVKNLMRKLGARTRAHAVAIALRTAQIDTLKCP